MCRNPDSARRLIILPIVKNLFIQTDVSLWLPVQIIPPKVAIRKSLFLEEFWVKTLSTLILHWIIEIEFARSSYNLIIWTHSIFKLIFLQKYCLEFFLQGLNLLFSTFTAISQKMLLIIHSVELWVTRIDRKWCRSHIFFHSTSFIFPSTCQSIVLLSEVDGSFLKLMKFVFCIRLLSWFAKSGKSSISVELSWYTNAAFAKTTFLNSSIKFWIDGGIFLIVL